jgi:prepilin-type N-terminal cleavage/methylation domain-containing protein
MASDAFKCNRDERGFSLIEVVVAVGLLAVLSIGVAQLFGMATKANHAAKGQTSTALLAVAKMEQVRGLAWGFDQGPNALGLPVSDLVTDLSVEPSEPGGLGLNPSPAGTLDKNVVGYVDFLDRNGRWVGNGEDPPRTAVYVRRWAVDPLPINPNNTLVLRVRCTTVDHLARIVGQEAVRSGDDTWLVGVKTRKSQ